LLKTGNLYPVCGVYFIAGRNSFFPLSFRLAGGQTVASKKFQAKDG
jgi:hypothetical protein